MTGQGAATRHFTGLLSRLAAEHADSRLGTLVAALQAPLAITVAGRRGVGCSAVAATLRAAGYRVTSGAAELTLYVLAEVCKPEDRRALTDTGVDLIVLNKADLAGPAPGGPMARSRRQAGQLGAEVGIGAVALAAPLALAALDPAALDRRAVAALRGLVDVPADMSSPDAFVSRPHDVPPADREMLVSRLDLLGIAYGVLTLRAESGVGAERLRRVFAEVSGLDELLAAVEAAAIRARFRRVRSVCDTLAGWAITDDRIAGFLHDDETVLARMAVAADVVQGAGLAVDTTGSAHLARARRWRRYAGGPVSRTHQQCAEDLVRGSLRLLHRGDGQ